VSVRELEDGKMMQKDTHEYPFFSHHACEFFPCHEGIDPSEFNCLFCYCPLYTLGSECGGNYSYTDKGVKDCTACALPHEGDAGTRHVKEKFALLAKMAEGNSSCAS
jgi:Zn-finger protein